MSTRAIMLAALPLSLALAACGSGDANPGEGTGDGDGVESVTTDREVEGVTAENDPSLVDLEGEIVAVAGGADAPLPPLLQPIGATRKVDLGATPGGCQFIWNGQSLYVAGAADNGNSRGKGVVQVDAEDVLLEGEETSGPDYITAGPSMTDGTISVEVRRAAGDGEAVGNGSRRWMADLSVRSGLGPERLYKAGQWTCAS